MPMMCPAWIGHYTKELPDTVCCPGAQNTPGESASPRLTQGLAVQDWLCTQMEALDQCEPKCWGRVMGQLEAQRHLLKSRTEEKATQGARVSQDPKMGVNVQVTEAALLPPPHCQSGRSYCFCSVTKSCPTLHDPMDCSTLGSSVLHYLSEFAQIHGH